MCVRVCAACSVQCVCKETKKVRQPVLCGEPALRKGLRHAGKVQTGRRLGKERAQLSETGEIGEAASSVLARFDGKAERERALATGPLTSYWFLKRGGGGHREEKKREEKKKKEKRRKGTEKEGEGE